MSGNPLGTVLRNECEADGNPFIACKCQQEITYRGAESSPEALLSLLESPKDLKGLQKRRSSQSLIGTHRASCVTRLRGPELCRAKLDSLPVTFATFCSLMLCYFKDSEIPEDSQWLSCEHTF